MYVVIMAGGGGTRLWPLSRPERPKPFLPLVGARSLLQLTIDRLEGLTDDITVVTDRRYEQLVRRQAPEVDVLAEPAGRNTAAAVALATVAIDRPEDQVMVVLPADHLIDPAREGVFRDVLRGAVRRAEGGDGGEGHEGREGREGHEGREGGDGDTTDDDRLVTLGIGVTGPSTEYGYLIPKLSERRFVDGLVSYPLQAFEEKPTAARAEELIRQEGVAWNAGMFIWRRRTIRRELERFTALIRLLEPTVDAPALLAHAYDQLKPVSIDNAVMEGAAAAGRVVMGTLDVGWSDLGSWSALLEAIGAGGSGAVVRAGETVDVDESDLVIRRMGDRVSAIRPPEAGSMTAAQPIAVLRGARASEVEALLDRCSVLEEAS